MRIEAITAKHQHMKTLLPILIMTTLLLGGCATDSDTPALFAGMSRDRLKAKFGEPVRIEHLFGGSEDWYYYFSNPWEVDTTSTHDGPPDADSGSLAIKKTNGKEERPVHLSPEGYVMNPLPKGHIVE